ncbi:hypothetical protein [Bradyrhizobium manausense]|uniref:hypothetical protein n=1 Tax=Bradyrhizobium manausense TaxID=989370 RepID=UPI001BA5BD87|nr:hypothetical protein [Bradyrhizobium manausense]MBR0721803.1 hypothetical protein [Bradyrhizobium manausense]
MNYIDCGYKNYAELARSAPQHQDAPAETYTVWRDAPEDEYLARAIQTNLISFDNYEQAVAFIGNCDAYRGDVLSIEKDGKTLFDAMWAETIGRYLNA